MYSLASSSDGVDPVLYAPKGGKRTVAIGWLLLPERDGMLVPDLSLSRGLVDRDNLGDLSAAEPSEIRLDGTQKKFALIGRGEDGHANPLAMNLSFIWQHDRWVKTSSIALDRIEPHLYSRPLQREESANLAISQYDLLSRTSGNRAEKVCDSIRDKVTQATMPGSLVRTIRTAVPCDSPKGKDDYYRTRTRDPESGLCDADEFPLTAERIVVGVHCKTFVPSWWSSKKKRMQPLDPAARKPHFEVLQWKSTGSDTVSDDRPAFIGRARGEGDELIVGFHTHNGQEHVARYAVYEGARFRTINVSEFETRNIALRRKQIAACQAASTLQAGDVPLAECDDVLWVKQGSDWLSPLALAPPGSLARRFERDANGDPWLILEIGQEVVLYSTRPNLDMVTLASTSELETLAASISLPSTWVEFEKGDSCGTYFLDVRAASDPTLPGEAEVTSPLQSIRYRGEKRLGYQGDTGGSGNPQANRPLRELFPNARVHCHVVYEP